MKKTILIVLLVVCVALLFFRTRTSTYAPPRDATTVLPFVEPSSNYPEPDSQSNVFMDAGGWLNQREHPLTPFIQGDARREGIMGDFFGLESSSGNAPMYVITMDQNVEEGGTCPRSIARLVNSDRTLEPGTYPIDNTEYYIEVTPPLRVIATGPDNTYYEMDYPTSEECPAPIQMRLDETKTYDTLELKTLVPQEQCPRSVVRLVNKDRILGPGTYPIDKASYLMNIYPPLKVIVTGPNAREESNYPTTEECPMAVKLQLDLNIEYDTLIISNNLTTNVTEVSEASVNKTVYDINEYGNLINPMMQSMSVTDERNFLFRR